MLITAMFILLVTINCDAQTAPNKELAQLLNIDYGFRLPYKYGDRRVIEAWSEPVSTKAYDARIYMDNQCKQYELASLSDGYYTAMMATFKIPDTNLFICRLFTEVGPTGYGTDVLLIIDEDGRIWDELCCKVDGEVFCVKQFSISSNYEITIYSIEPIGSKSVSLWDPDASFKGYRQDCVYEVKNGKFVLKGFNSGDTITITRASFEKQRYFWEPIWRLKPNIIGNKRLQPGPLK